MNTRNERASAELLRNLTYIIQNKMNDPRIDKFVTITNVKLAKDFRVCKIFVSTLDLSLQDKTIEVLQNSEGFIKTNLKSLMLMPEMPKLIFVKDKSAENVSRVEELLKTIKYSDKE